ncbi:MAG: peptidoglycan-binding protein, partial [Bacteroidota bacterium]|nr:peptidoglycan-binding protein [Bacteroidota bacterium]
MDYPKRIIEKGESNKSIVKAIQNQLNLKGCGPIDVDGDYGNQTVGAVKLFQIRHADANGASLIVDGKIGPITWQILFGSDTVPVIEENENNLLSTALKIAVSQIGVEENPPYSNRGKEVDMYIRETGLNPEGNHYSWCMAFVYWCFSKASQKIGKTNPMVKTAGCVDQWNRTTCKKINGADAVQNPLLIQPGHVFIIKHNDGSGHTGIVESVNGGFLTTIEGNTNMGGSSNG